LSVGEIVAYREASVFELWSVLPRVRVSCVSALVFVVTFGRVACCSVSGVLIGDIMSVVTFCARIGVLKAHSRLRVLSVGCRSSLRVCSLPTREVLVDQRLE